MVATLLGGVAGVWLQLQQAFLWPSVWYAVMVLAGACALLWLWQRAQAQDRTLAPLVWALLAALCWFGLTGWRAQSYAEQALKAELEGQLLELTGRVAGLPRQREQGGQFEFLVEQARYLGREVAVPGRVQLNWGNAYAARSTEAPHVGAPPLGPLDGVRAGQRWRLTARLVRPHGNVNPHGFDYELWLWTQGIQATGHVHGGRTATPPELLGQTWRHPVDRARQAVRDAIFDRVGDARSAGVLAALVVGDQSSIEQADWEVFRLTGVAHLVSISGLHVTMFAWLAVGLVGWLWRRAGWHWPGLLWRVPVPHAAAIGGVGLAAAYALFSGWGVPAQRTVLMLTVVVLLRLASRRWPWPVVWLAAMNVVLALDPWALLQPGFWLSFVAVGVLFASSPPMPVTGSAIGRRLLTLLREQAVVTVALAPLTLMVFGQFSLAGLVANLGAIPWVTLVVTPLAMLGVIWSGVWDLGAWAVQALVTGLGWLASWPWAAVERPAVPWGLALAGVAGGVLLVLRWPWSLRLWGLLLVWPVLSYVPESTPQGQFQVVAADVGQGSAVLVRTASHALLYDTGPAYGRTSAGDRVLLPLLRSQGVKLDAVMVSHSDNDHAGGMNAIASRHGRALWWSSFDEMPTGLEQPVQRCEAGQAWEWDGVSFEVLHPRAEDYGVLSTTNALSCVLLVRSGSQGMLLTGDITLAEEARIALAHPDLHPTVLLAPHHGSKSSSGPVLLNSLKPKWIVVQAGYRNRYGHPAPEVVRRYEARAIPWVESPTCGAATWRSWQPEDVSCQRKLDRRYWRYGEM